MIDDDVKAGVRLPDGALKKISEEKLMTGEHKNGSHFQFTSRVLPLLLCNNPPSIADLSKGLERRIYVIPFDRTFDKPDAQRFDSIWRSEMSGIFNRYLEGLCRVVARGWAFERPTSIRTATDEFLTGANPLPEFVAEMCDTGTKKSDRLEFLYQHYCNWSTNNGITLRQQKSAFKRNLAHLGYTITKRNDGLHVVGLSLKSQSS
jgi:phage/plasmid-associated DNA primase